MEEIPIELIEQALALAGPDSNFAFVMNVVNQYRDADMTPHVFMDDINGGFRIHCEETYGKLLH